MNRPRASTTARLAPPRVIACGVAAAAGFTVIEMLLVVGIVALLTVGLAQVFRVSGETVRAGQRISSLTGYAAMIEKQMRADFANLSREGFMVMRHATAGNAPPRYDNAIIQLAPNDPNPRTRRVDELVFFVTGEFVTKRDPVYPTRQARATQARIYYGHGHRQDPNADGYYDPITLDDLNNDPIRTPKFGRTGPNQYASNWILLRHETLLVQPSTVTKERIPAHLSEPNPCYDGSSDPNTANVEDLDSDIQIELQPAASSIFRLLRLYEPWNGDPRFNNSRVVRDDMTGGVPARPAFASGVIDIATTDLSEIRAFILDAQGFAARSAGMPPLGLRFDDRDITGFAGDDPVPGSFFFTDPNPVVTNSVTKRMQGWMRQALPANSDAGERMRCEFQPPNFLGSINNPSGAVFTKEYQRTDQMMLCASNFVPHCSEFIVEWSFGKAYPPNDPLERDGQLIWHGLERPGAVTPTGTTTFAALPYGDTRANGVDLYQMPYRRNDGTIGYWPPKEAPGMWNLNVAVVRDYNPFGAGATAEYSFFGYIDPTYRIRSAWTDLPEPGSNPPRGNGLFDGISENFEDLNGNGRQDADEPTLGGDMWYDPPPPGQSNAEKPDPREPTTIPWPWPKLVRITLSIADPVEPLREQTFQFILEVPESLTEAPPL